MTSARPRIGDLLREQSIVDDATIEKAAELQRTSGLRLASQLWTLGAATEAQLVSVLAAQLGTPGCVLGRSSVEISIVHRLPAVMAHERGAMPIGMVDEHLLVVAADPLDERLVGETKLIAQCNVTTYVGLQAALSRAVTGAYTVHPSDTVTHWFGWDADQRMPGYREVLPAPPENPLEDLDDLPSLEGELLEQVSQIFVSAEEVPAASSRPVVLLVDDDANLNEMIQVALERLDLDVVSCFDGREAAKKLQEMQPDVVILDVMLPGVHGFELARMIKSGQRFARTRLIMMSGAYKGWRIQQDVKESFDADAYFEKPFELIPLRLKVQELLGEADEGASKPSASAVQAFRNALEAQKAGNTDQAEYLLKEAIEYDPFFVNAHLLLAVIYTRLKKPYQATDTLEVVIDLDPTNYKALVSLATLYEQTGFRHKAAGTWERALFAAPDDVSRENVRKKLSALLG